MAKMFTEADNNAWAQQLPGKMTSACVAVRHGGKILMVKATYKDHWTFPGGIVDAGESPKQAALRETHEETGLALDGNDCELLGVVYTASNGSDRDRFNFAFIVDVPAIDFRLTVPNDEIEAVEWVDSAEIATYSGGRESYIRFQAILTGDKPLPSYEEIVSAG